MPRERGTGSGEAVETDAQQKAEDALKSYAIVQYDQLFGNDRG